MRLTAAQRVTVNSLYVFFISGRFCLHECRVFTRRLVYALSASLPDDRRLGISGHRRKHGIRKFSCLDLDAFS